MKAWAIKLIDLEEIHVFPHVSRKSVREECMYYSYSEAKLVRVRITEIKPRKRKGKI